MVEKYVKVAIYIFIIFSLLAFILGLLIFSNFFLLNLFANLLIKSSIADPSTIDFQAYSKEEFAAEFLNTSLSPEDDFIKLFESHYGTEHKKEGLFLVTYDIQDPNNKSKFTLYGINKHMDLVYKNTRVLDITDPKNKRIKFHKPRDQPNIGKRVIE
jgi:hypothetical protein